MNSPRTDLFQDTYLVLPTHLHQVNKKVYQQVILGDTRSGRARQRKCYNQEKRYLLVVISIGRGLLKEVMTDIMIILRTLIDTQTKGSHLLSK